MKKLAKLIFLAIACCFAVMPLVGCAEKPDSLQYNTKYINYEYIHADEGASTSYFIFYSNGICMLYSQVAEKSSYTYDEYYNYVDYVYKKKYTTKTFYKYTYADEQGTSVVCFFDSIETTYYDVDGNVSKVVTEPSASDYKSYIVCSVSKNVLSVVTSRGDSSFYINEKYIDEIPNFYPNDMPFDWWS